MSCQKEKRKLTTLHGNKLFLLLYFFSCHLTDLFCLMDIFSYEFILFGWIWQFWKIYPVNMKLSIVDAGNTTGKCRTVRFKWPIKCHRYLLVYSHSLYLSIDLLSNIWFLSKISSFFSFEIHGESLIKQTYKQKNFFLFFYRSLVRWVLVFLWLFALQRLMVGVNWTVHSYSTRYTHAYDTKIKQVN